MLPTNSDLISFLRGTQKTGRAIYEVPSSWLVVQKSRTIKPKMSLTKESGEKISNNINVPVNCTSLSIKNVNVQAIILQGFQKRQYAYTQNVDKIIKPKAVIQSNHRERNSKYNCTKSTIKNINVRILTNNTFRKQIIYRTLHICDTIA